MKNLLHFTNINLLDIENSMLSQHSQNPVWLYKFSSKNGFCLVPKITFALHHFLTSKNRILEEIWKQMPVYFGISPEENFCSRDAGRFYLGESGIVGWGRLNNFLKSAGCLGLAKCFTIFHFNWKFWKFNHFLAFCCIHL